MRRIGTGDDVWPQQAKGWAAARRVVGVMVTAVMLIVAGPASLGSPASAAPTASRAPGVAVHSARVSAPPRMVDRASLVRLFDRAARASVRGVAGGARIRVTRSYSGQSTWTTHLRLRGQRFVSRSPGDLSVYDASRNLSYTHVPEIASLLEVTPAELAAVLASLGRADATWVSFSVLPSLEFDPWGNEPLEQVGDLGWLARNATDWSWRRSRGRTTWTERMSVPGGIEVRARIVLDRKGRLVRETETWRSRAGHSFTDMRVRYGGVRRIAVPPESQVVDGQLVVDVLDGVDPGVARSRLRRP